MIRLPRSLWMGFLASLAAQTCLAQPAPLSIALQPLGRVEPGMLRFVQAEIQGTFLATVTILARRELPAEAWYEPRRRHRGEILLEHLERSTPTHYAKVIGLTSRDISVTKAPFADWGVYGVGRLSARPCAFSTFRLRKGRATPGRFRHRVRTVALHELGHTFGLPHCSTPRCLMADAQGGMGPVDATDGRFCEACAGKLPGALKAR